MKAIEIGRVKKMSGEPFDITSDWVNEVSTSSTEPKVSRAARALPAAGACYF
jgi:hypothetical protein